MKVYRFSLLKGGILLQVMTFYDFIKKEDKLFPAGDQFPVKFKEKIPTGKNCTVRGKNSSFLFHCRIHKNPTVWGLKYCRIRASPDQA